MQLRAIAPALLLACGTFAISAEADAGLPKIPKNTAMLGVVADPAATIKNIEAMAARIGMAPPNSKPGWVLNHPAFGPFEGQVDMSKPVVVAVTKPKMDGKDGPSAEFLVMLPVLKKANVEKLVAALSGKEKLHSRREGNYVLLTASRRLLAKKRRRRRISAQDLAAARTLDIALLTDPKALSSDALTKVLDKELGDSKDPGQRLGQSFIKTMMAMSAQGAPKGSLSLFGVSFAKDGLRMRSRASWNKKSDLGRWMMAAKTQSAPLVRGHRAGPMMGSLGVIHEPRSTVALVRAMYRRTVSVLSKAEMKELAPLEALAPEFEKAFLANPAVSVVVRPGKKEMPQVTVIMPRLPADLLKKIPSVKQVPEDKKHKVPAHWVVALDPETRAYFMAAGDLGVLAVGVGQLELADILASATKNQVPMAQDSRYKTARASLPDKLNFEMYVDPGPVMSLLMQNEELAQFRPMAKLVSAMPPIAIGVTTKGMVAEAHIFVADGILGLAGMVANMAMAGPGAR